MLELIDGREQATPVHIARPRPAPAAQDPRAAVTEVVEDVRLRGDEALIELTERFDGVRLTPERIVVDPASITKATELVRPELLHALEVMAERLRRTCERQAPQEWTETGVGESVGELIRPLRRVGVYAPGGRASYPSSVVMAAIPAQVAGVEGIAICSPPQRGTNEIAESVLAACAITGVTEVYRIGGAQAIA